MLTAHLAIPSGDALVRLAHPPDGGALFRPAEGPALRQHVLIADLRPTQFAVGFREVAHKRRRYRQASSSERLALIHDRPVPVVLGAGGHLFALDRHHWLCALQAEGVAAAPTSMVDDLSALRPDRFWRTLDARGWCRLHDAAGRRRHYEELPPALSGLRDDPFRSLASALKRGGGVDKIEVPFSEFQWADRLRQWLDHDALVRDFDGALEKAIAWARDGRPRDRCG